MKNTQEITVTGGIEAGWAHASWPFAKLKVTADSLSLSAVTMGSYRFNLDEVVALEPYGSIPVFARGVRIIHTNAQFPEKITFWCLGSRDELLERIKRLGFRPNAQRSQIPKRSGSAFRWSFLAFILILWNGLIFLDVGFPPEPGAKMGLYTLCAVALLFTISMSISYSSQAQRFALKESRSILEVRPVVSLIAIISGAGTLAMCASLCLSYFGKP